MTFRLGQEVICIRDNWGPDELLHLVNNLPRKGAVYRIAGFHDVGSGHLLLDGINAGPWGRASFAAFCFRPLTTRDTSAGVEALRKLLDRNNHTIPLPEDALQHELDRIADEALR